MTGILFLTYRLLPEAEEVVGVGEQTSALVSLPNLWNLLFLVMIYSVLVEIYLVWNRSYKLTMNESKLLGELKEQRCLADWHSRYYSDRARKYHRIDHWFKVTIGLASVSGIVIAGFNPVVGATIAGLCAFVSSTIIPILKWDEIIDGFKSEADDWMDVFVAYQNLISNVEISDRGEILSREYQRILEKVRGLALNGRYLPVDENLRNIHEAGVREYYGLDRPQTGNS